MDITTMLAQGTMLRNGTYRVERPLSAGGFGNTYLVRNVAFDEPYAMKEFFMRGVNMRKGNSVTVSVPDNHASYESQKEKFRKEAVRLRNLNNAHIVKVHDLFEENSTVYYVMDYIDGQSVAEQMKRSGQPVGEQQAWAILPQVLDALREVHAHSIWHLDIKPGNIMLDRQGNAYLIDFGASKQVTSTGSQTSSALCYTPGYAPVEQVEQDFSKFGPWTDFYALGATLYYMQTRQQPPSSTAISDGDAFRFPQTMSQPMRELIVWLMSPSRKKRPQSVAEIMDRIRPVLEQKGTYIPYSGKDDDAATVPVPPSTQLPKPGHQGGRNVSNGQGQGGSQATALATSPHPKPKKRSNALLITLITLIVVAGLGAGTYFLFFAKSAEEKAAEAALEEYEELVEDCRAALKKADSFPQLTEAKNMLPKVEEMEDEYAAVMPDAYNQLEGLEKLYKKMEKKQRQEYIDLAKQMLDMDDYRSAYDLYAEALEVLSDDEELSNSMEDIGQKMGYVYVTDVQFANRLNGEDIEAAGTTLHSENMRYLVPKVIYNSLLPSGRAMVRNYFRYKIFDSDGVLDQSDSSPAGYTNGGDFNVAPGEVNQGEFLGGGWGNANVTTWKADDYTFELYYQGRKIYTGSFTIR